ncbi:hypothetical protein G3N94_22050, partial [Burkholderia sp. Ac-20353]|nr:hypothetical protein [Burkholderia sp. Ac-20353]
MTGSVTVGTVNARRQRVAVGALAFVVAASLHWLGWLALRSVSTAGRDAALPAVKPARRALNVELIPLPAQAPALPRREPATVAPVRGRPDAAAAVGRA